MIERKEQIRNLVDTEAVDANDFIGYSILSIPTNTENNVFLTTPLSHVPESAKGSLRIIHSDHIIGAMGIESWGNALQKIPSVYVSELITAIQEDPLYFLKNPQTVIAVEDFYVAMSPGIGIAAAKQSNKETIPAMVYEASPTGVIAYNKNDYAELIHRQQEGLWDGTWQIHETDTGVSFAIASVEHYVAPWVFAKNIAKAKRVSTAISD